MSQSDSGQALADLLTELKRRNGGSYERIARRAHLSRSTVHRYCSGQSIPASFGSIETIARACGADQGEISRLYRLWEQSLCSKPGSEPAPESGSEAGSEPEVAEPEPLRRSRRWWLAGGALTAVVVLGITAYTFVPAREPAAPPITPIAAPNWTLPPYRIEPEFVGVTINNPTGLMPDFPVGSVRLWESKTRWDNLEHRPQQYDWSTLERLLGGAEQAELPAVYTFGGTPGWANPDSPRTPYNDDSRTGPPEDLADWERFVRALATHAKGRIDTYELWDFGTPPYFSGSMATLAEMTRIGSRTIREVDPGATVLCPGFGQLWSRQGRAVLQQFAELGGYTHCDGGRGGVKLHPRDVSDPPETMVELATEIKKTLQRTRTNTKLWNTGVSYEGPMQEPVEPELAADYAVRYFLVSMWMGYERVYFYSWGGDEVPIVLQPTGFKVTRAGRFVGELQRWIGGAWVSSCGHGAKAGLPENAWSCQFTRDGRPFSIVWTHEGSWQLPAAPGSNLVRHLDGTARPVHPGELVTITGRPVLIE